MSSNSTADGRFSIAVTFDLGTNLDIAQVQVQNRVAIAQPRLPADVRNIGVTVTKASPDLMMVVHLYSPDKSRDTLFISNYADARDQRRADPRRRRRLDHRVRQPRLCDADLARSRPPAVARPDRERRRRGAARPERAGRLRRAQPAAGRPSRARSRSRCRRSGGSPIPTSSATSSSSRPPNAVVRLKDVAPHRACRAGLFDRIPISIAIPRSRSRIFQRPGSNALATADGIIARPWTSLSKRFPTGVKHAIVYNPTQFIQQSVNAVSRNHRRGDPPRRAGGHPVPADLARRDHPDRRHSGFADRHLLLHGDCSASRSTICRCSGWCWRSASWSTTPSSWSRTSSATSRPGSSRATPRIKSMDEVGAALIAIALVLCAVFVPVRLHHRHLRPVLPAVRAHHRRRDDHLADRVADAVAGAVRAAAQAARRTSAARAGGAADPRLLRRVQPRLRARSPRGYGWLVGARRALRRAHAGRLCRQSSRFGLNEFRKTPVGFIPQLDRGYLIVVTQLPPGASLGAHRRGQRGASSISRSRRRASPTR